MTDNEYERIRLFVLFDVFCIIAHEIVLFQFYGLYIVFNDLKINPSAFTSSFSF